MNQVAVEADDTASPPKKNLREQVIGLIAKKGYEEREKPFQLSSGELSRDYIDCKRAVAHGDDLRLVSEAIVSTAEQLDIDFDAVGGLTMGADSIAHGVAMVARKQWFTVRKEQKAHGKQKMIEGAELQPGARVLLVDDVATTGDSIMKAVYALREIGAEIVLAVPIVDRGDVARGLLEDEGIRYEPLLTYRDLGIEPVGQGSA